MIRSLRILGFVLMLGISPSLFSQIAFWQTYSGGSAFDKGKELLLLEDGTLVLAGETQSVNELGTGNHSPDYDLFVYKYSTQGKRFWKSILGGKGAEFIGEMVETDDGGFLIVGTSNSQDGDVPENAGGTDIWVVKLDGEGNISWSKTFGGRGDDMGTAALQLRDGNFLIGGESGSIDHSDVPTLIRHHGALDSWIAKLSPSGELIWERLMGGTQNEQVSRLHERPDGSLVVIHGSDSQDGDVKTHLGGKDVWITQLNAEGEDDWQIHLGGGKNEDIHASQMDEAGNLILGGTTFSDDGDVSVQRGLGDCWLVKLSPQGQVIWSNTYGGRRPEGINDLVIDEDGGIVFVGLTKSRSGEGDIRVNKGSYDGWMVKTKANGELAWSRTAGYEGSDRFESLIMEPGGGLLTLGYSIQAPNAPEIPDHKGLADVWLANYGNIDRSGVKPFRTPPILFGKVVDQETMEPLAATITLTDNETLDSLTSVQTDLDSGAFVLLLPPYGLVSINILAKGYMFYGRDIRMDTIATSKTTTDQLFALEKIEVGSSLILKNISFETGKWDILKPSYAELERVVAFLELNPKVWIEISGHTDNTGNAGDKKELSLLRATAVKDYLKSRGIPHYRMREAGYGMNKPIATNRTRNGRRRNRRVEFTVIQK